MNEMLEVAANGCTDLPPGKIANVVTYLECKTRPPPRSTLPRPELALARLTGRDLGRYLTMFRRLGERWLWWSRLDVPHDRLVSILDDANVEVYALTCHDHDAGLLELDFCDGKAAELAFFGLVEGMIGTGAGRWLMDCAIAKAWARSPDRFFVHTCTFDHPNAVEFYRRSGFTAYKFALELADDPRRTGLLPRSAGPHVPLLEPARLEPARRAAAVPAPAAD